MPSTDFCKTQDSKPTRLEFFMCNGRPLQTHKCSEKWSPSKGEVDKRPRGSPTGETPVLKFKEHLSFRGNTSCPEKRGECLPKIDAILMFLLQYSLRPWSRWDVFILSFLFADYSPVLYSISDITPDEVENPSTPDQNTRLVSVAFSDLARLWDVSVHPDYLENSLKAIQYFKGMKTLATPHQDGKELSFQSQGRPWDCSNTLWIFLILNPYKMQVLVIYLQVHIQHIVIDSLFVGPKMSGRLPQLVGDYVLSDWYEMV